MTDLLSEQNRALVLATLPWGPKDVDSAYVAMPTKYLNDLIDAARAETTPEPAGWVPRHKTSGQILWSASGGLKSIIERAYMDAPNFDVVPLYLASPASAGSEGGQWRPTHRHVKRGTDYQFVDEADLQTEKPISDYAVLTVYRGADGRLWARPSTEFNDGRFEPLPPSPSDMHPSVRAETGGAV